MLQIRKVQEIDPLSREFVNLFTVELSQNPKVFSRAGESRIYFDHGDTCVGNVNDNPAYLRQYILQKARKTIEGLQLEKWLEQKGPTQVSQTGYLLSLRVKTLAMVA